MDMENELRRAVRGGWLLLPEQHVDGLVQRTGRVLRYDRTADRAQVAERLRAVVRSASELGHDPGHDGGEPQ